MLPPLPLLPLLMLLLLLHPDVIIDITSHVRSAAILVLLKIRNYKHDCIVAKHTCNVS
jgi:hypothetical protein